MKPAKDIFEPWHCVDVGVVGVVFIAPKTPWNREMRPAAGSTGGTSTLPCWQREPRTRAGSDRLANLPLGSGAMVWFVPIHMTWREPRIHMASGNFLDVNACNSWNSCYTMVETRWNYWCLLHILKHRAGRFTVHLTVEINITLQIAESLMILQRLAFAIID